MKILENKLNSDVSGIHHHVVMFVKNFFLEFCLFAFSLNVPKWSAFDVRLEIITTAQDSSLESCVDLASGDCGADGRNARVEMTGRTLRVDCTWAVAFIQWNKPFQKLLKTGSKIIKTK